MSYHRPPSERLPAKAGSDAAQRDRACGSLRRPEDGQGLAPPVRQVPVQLPPGLY